MKTIFTILLLLYVSYLHATIITVPTQYITIQAGILAASNGDTVLVLPGTYTENIHFRGRKIVLTSRFYLNHDTTYICNTIIDGSNPASPDSASCIMVHNGEDSTTVIQGFTIMGGAGTKWTDEHGAGVYREGGGILTAYTSPIIQFNIIRDNLILNTTGVSSTGGGAMRCGDGSPTVRNNIIYNNQARYGCGIVFNYCTGRIQNNIIRNNSGGQNFGGGGLWLNGLDHNTIVYVTNNTIINNHISGTGLYGGKGGGIMVFAIKAIADNNLIWGNTQIDSASLSTFFNGLIQIHYSNLQPLIPGIGNISQEPALQDTFNCLLSSTSPCIDMGNNLPQYNDKFLIPDIALFPSMGNTRNDIGAYGGPNANLLYDCMNKITALPTLTPKSEFYIYPNPIDTQLNIQIPKNLIGNYTLSLMNEKGDIVLSRPLADKIDVSGIASGIYFVSIREGNKQIYQDKIEIK